MPGYHVYLTERFAEPGRVRVAVLGDGDRPTLSVAKARHFADHGEAERVAGKIRREWTATVVAVVPGGGLPALAWDAETK